MSGGSRAIVLLWFCACAGPPATDAEICRDVIHRVCNSGCVDAFDRLLLPRKEPQCEPTLLTRTGCGSDDLKLDNRTNFLSCRLPLLRAGDHVDTPPSCDDVDDTFRGCPSLLTFLGGR